MYQSFYQRVCPYVCHLGHLGTGDHLDSLDHLLYRGYPGPQLHLDQMTDLNNLAQLNERMVLKSSHPLDQAGHLTHLVHLGPSWQ